MKYYYLDGIDKKGPYEKEELKNCNLNPEILVFTDEFSSWKPIKDLPELNNYLFEIESEGDTSDLKNNITENTKDITRNQKKNIQKTEPNKIKIPSIFLLFSSFLICIGIAYYIVINQRQKDSQEINQKIEEIFKGKNAITDYLLEGVDGQLYDVYLGSSWEGLLNDNVLRTKKRILAFRPTSESDQNKEKRWNLFKNLVQYYETAPSNGFNVIRIEKSSTIFTIKTIWSGDMGYKVPEKEYHEGYSGEYYSIPGYELPTYRPSIGKSYEEAAKFLTSDKADESYEAGTYNKILSFEDLNTEFFEINQRFPKYTRLGNKIHIDNGAGIGEGDLIDDSKITDATSANDAAVYTSQWIVWYKSITNTYEIEEKKGIFVKYWVIYSAIGITIATLIYLLLKYRKRISLN